MAGNDVIGSMIFEGKSPFSRAISANLTRGSKSRRKGSKIWQGSCFSFFVYAFSCTLRYTESVSTSKGGKSKGVLLCVDENWGKFFLSPFKNRVEGKQKVGESEMTAHQNFGEGEKKRCFFERNRTLYVKKRTQWERNQKCLPFHIFRSSQTLPLFLLSGGRV